MPAFRFTARWLGESALPEDVYENVLYYDVTQAEGTFEAICDGIVAAFTAWGAHGDVDGAEVRVYALTGGQPLYSKAYPAYVFTATTGPGEVAICLSYASAPNWESTTARRRGRLFLGPMASLYVGGPRPIQSFINQTLELGQALGVVGAGVGASWMQFSQVDQVATAIATISVDDAWDTQRRRGLSPTNRTVQPLAA
jgi:hypothetical protein